MQPKGSKKKFTKISILGKDRSAEALPKTTFHKKSGSQSQSLNTTKSRLTSNSAAQNYVRVKAKMYAKYDGRAVQKQIPANNDSKSAQHWYPPGNFNLSSPKSITNDFLRNKRKSASSPNSNMQADPRMRNQAKR